MGKLGLWIVSGIFCASIGGVTAFAQVAPVREDAFNNQSRHAWRLFLMLNHPAKDPKLGERGVPDLTKPIGAPGTTTVWETWRAATPEVFKADGSRPPADFNDMSLVNSCPAGKVPELEKKVLIARMEVARKQDKSGVRLFFDPADGIGFPGGGGFGETRVNRSTYDTILSNGLYNVEGQKTYAQQVIAGIRKPLAFEPESMEVKAGWIELTPQQAASKTYYSVNWNNKIFGLQTLHIITKDIPNWFWTTFHHKDGFPGGAETPDTFGRPKELTGTVWENYVLGGTQTDFVNTIGEPTFLSDGYIEQDFKRSSCISCHARAGRGPQGERLSGSDPSVGIPTTSLFKTGANALKIVQTDFVWSIPLRARPISPGQAFVDPCATQK